MEPIQRIDNAWANFQDWLRRTLGENNNAAALLIPGREGITAQQREILRFIKGTENAVDRARERILAGTAPNPAELASLVEQEVELTKREVQALLGSKDESNLPLIAGVAAAALVLFYLARK